MNKKLRKALAAAFEPPKPVRKSGFMRTVKIDSVGLIEFTFSQLRYIRKRTWLLSLAALGVAAYAFVSADKTGLWAASALVPWLAVTVATESGRSEACGMAELEASMRFSLTSLTLARLSIIGAVHFILLCLFTAVCGGFPASRTALYLLTPYLLTLDLSMPLSRKFGGLSCLGAAALVSGGALILKWQGIYRPELVRYWTVALAVLVLIVCSEIKKVMRRSVRFGTQN